MFLGLKQMGEGPENKYCLMETDSRASRCPIMENRSTTSIFTVGNSPLLIPSTTKIWFSVRRAPDYGDPDILAEVLPAARILPTYHSTNGS